MTSYIDKIREPKFEQVLVADQLNDGYWLEAPDINNNGTPDLFGYGLRLGELYWYETGPSGDAWTKRLVADGIRMPVGGHYANIKGDDHPDLVVCYELYGEGGRINDPDPDGGKIDWLENPGREGPEAYERRWARHYVGREVGMHRLRVGHLTQDQKLEIMGVPVVGLTNVHGLIPVVLFTSPPLNEVRTATEWVKTVVDDTHFRMIHGAELVKNAIPGSRRDSIILASEEGVTWLYHDQGSWHRVLIGTGELGQFEQTTFKGSGDVNVGRVGTDPFAYVAATEPFHGNTVAVYVKDTPGIPVAQARWRRVVLDVFGDPNELGEGPSHQVVCADFDGDGDDEFLVALRGPYPWQGVMYYKAIDLARGIFAKWRISSESTARIATGHFGGQDGLLDFATIAYKVDKYYVAKEPKLLVFRNQTQQS
ncbi:hypothetical protein [Actinophytocola sp.]|uniref:hypothetical protein n=1 Tax=Actinophytocola sp. TaxID=1872138 RepID=UPI002ED5F30D